MCWQWYDKKCICSISYHCHFKWCCGLLTPGGRMCYLLSVVQVLHGQPRVALSQTLPGKATVGQGELQAGGRQKWWWGGVVWQNTILDRDDEDTNRISHKTSQLHVEHSCCWIFFSKWHSNTFVRAIIGCAIQLPCREKTCGQRGLWRAQKADTPWVCSCRCCNRTYPCPACPNPSSSPAGRLKAGDRREGLFTMLNTSYLFV